MSQYSQRFDFPDHVHGDRWDGFSINSVTYDDGSSPQKALARVRMHFKLEEEVYKLDSQESEAPDAPIEIIDPATWQIKVAPINNFLPAVGYWKYDIEFYETDSDAPRTLMQGEIRIIQDITTD